MNGSELARDLRAVGSVLMRIGVVLLTLLLLASIGGGMALAAPVLVPIHWFLARSASSGWTRGGWIFLAVFSIWEAAWIYAYVLVQNETIAVFTGLAISLFGAMAFVATTGVHETAPPTIGSTS